MQFDILAEVREEILKEDAALLPWIPNSLDMTWEFQAGIAGALSGMWAGAAFGAHLGIAGAFGAVAGTIPCAIVGGVVGYLAGAKIGSNVNRNPFSLMPAKEPYAIMPPRSAEAIAEGKCCVECGASRATWWDSHQDRCGRCGFRPTVLKIESLG